MQNNKEVLRLSALSKAIAFLDQCRADKTAAEVGALRDAHEMLESSARALLSHPAAPAQPTEGQEVSIDVSTGDEDAGHRIFAQLTGDIVGDVWLAEETGRNFVDALSAPAAQQPTNDHDFSFSLVERVRKACTQMGIATSESLEECSVRLESMLYALCSAIDSTNGLITTQQPSKRELELEAARIAYASDLPPDADGEPDVGNIHANIRKLKAQIAQQPSAEPIGITDDDGQAWAYGREGGKFEPRIKLYSEAQPAEKLQAISAELLCAVEAILDDGHMNQEHLARLRAAWEGVWDEALTIHLPTTPAQEAAREQPATLKCGACPDDFSKSAYCTTCPEQPADERKDAVRRGSFAEVKCKKCEMSVISSCGGKDCPVPDLHRATKGGRK